MARSPAEDQAFPTLATLIGRPALKVGLPLDENLIVDGGTATGAEPADPLVHGTMATVWFGDEQ